MDRKRRLMENNNGWPLRNQLFDGAPIALPLTHTVIGRGGLTPSFTRATTGTVSDNEGILRTAIAGEARFTGARRVENLIRLGAAQSSTLAIAASVTMTLPAGTYIFSQGVSAGTATFSGTGGATGTLAASASVRTSVVKTITAGTLIVTGSVAILTDIQVENITGRTDQTTPSEYVSVGVLSSPYHGTGVDGVKCFDTTLTGAALPTSYTYDAVNLNGVAGAYVSTPDSVAASITGDIDIRVKAALTDWTPAAIVTLVSKWDSGSTKSYMLNVESGGILSAFMSPDGSATNNDVYSTTATGFSDGTAHWCRVVRVAATGVVTFYTSSDGDSWTQLGTPVVGVAGDIFDSTSIVEIGSLVGGVANNVSGKIYAAQIYNGIDGTLAVDFNAARYTGGTMLTGSTGETWTLHGNAVIHPTNSPNLGYLPEPAATNLCLQSNAFGTTWVKDEFTGTVTITNDNGVAPDGTTTAEKIEFVAAVAPNQATLDQTITVANATAYTGSIYVKAFAAGDIGKKLVIRHAGGVTYREITLTADWQRFSNTETSVATSASFSFGLRPSVGGSSGTVTAYVWGAQLELGSAATSYIPTTTIAVARNADVLTYTGGDIANIKTLACTFQRAVGVLNNGWAVALSDGTINNYMSVSVPSATQARFLGVAGAATQWDVIPAYTDGTQSNAAFSAATNDIKMDKDGTAQTQDTSATVPTVTQLNVGHIAGSFQLNGNVRGIYGWTRNLSQSELGAIDR